MSNLASIRLNTFNENFVNETDQDATSLLTELDKGNTFNSPKMLQINRTVLISQVFDHRKSANNARQSCAIQRYSKNIHFQF